MYRILWRMLYLENYIINVNKFEVLVLLIAQLRCESLDYSVSFKSIYRSEKKRYLLSRFDYILSRRRVQCFTDIFRCKTLGYFKDIEVIVTRGKHIIDLLFLIGVLFLIELVAKSSCILRRLPAFANAVFFTFLTTFKN